MTLRQNAAWLVVLLAGSLMGCQGQISRKPPAHPQLNMDFQNRVDPQEAESFFADQRGMRTPPAGTVATTLATDDVHLQEDSHMYRGIVNGQFSDTLPAGVTLDQALLDRGEERYGIFCAVCHGHTGDGNAIAVARGLQQPPSYHEQRLREQPVGYLYSVTTNGIRTMSPYKSQISVDDRWAIAAYIKALQVSQQSPLALVPPDVAAQKGWR